MERFEKIAALENDVEALCLKEELEERGIPHGIQSKYDLAYDGLFQFTSGWGHVEAPVERREEILGILGDIRHRVDRQNNQTDEQNNI
ncbi:MAG: hypothetical protein JXB10_11265 [Pirellulales bacterium]|nr:hypothetical protein [Pirellulales bacterium]